MCMAVGKPSAAQFAGVSSGTTGNGTTVTSYTPNYGSIGNSVVANNPKAAGYFTDQGGTYTLSNGTTASAKDVIAQNQQNAYGQTIGHRFDQGIATQLVGKELNAAPAVQNAGVQETNHGGGRPFPEGGGATTQNPASTSTGGAQTAYAGGESSTVVIEKRTAAMQQGSTKGNIKRKKSTRRSSGGDSTVVTGGSGIVTGTTGGGNKELLGT